MNATISPEKEVHKSVLIALTVHVITITSSPWLLDPSALDLA